MKLIALCGAAGAGKDTVADMLPARKLAFADALYREVGEAWGITVGWLQNRNYKEHSSNNLEVGVCRDERFITWCWGQKCGHKANLLNLARSPRQILQWWGDYRRAQDPDYFATSLRFAILDGPPGDVVITDVRFPNEAALVRQLGGQLWQIRRPGYEAGSTGHASDTDGSEFEPDRMLVNGGNLEQLRDLVLTAWEAI